MAEKQKEPQPPIYWLMKLCLGANLKRLIDTEEGKEYFEYWISSESEIKMYWVFYSTVNKILKDQDSTETFASIQHCFNKHISGIADSDDRIDFCLKPGMEEKLRKLIDDQQVDMCLMELESLKVSAFQYLDQEFFWIFDCDILLKRAYKVKKLNYNICNLL